MLQRDAAGFRSTKGGDRANLGVGSFGDENQGLKDPITPHPDSIFRLLSASETTQSPHLGRQYLANAPGLAEQC
jgi:hypothetical protein